MRHFNDYDTKHVAHLIGDLADVETCEVSRLQRGDFFVIYVIVGNRVAFEIRSIEDCRLRMKTFVISWGKRDVYGKAEHEEKFGMLDNAVKRIVELLKENQPAR